MAPKYVHQRVEELIVSRLESTGFYNIDKKLQNGCKKIGMVDYMAKGKNVLLVLKKVRMTEEILENKAHILFLKSLHRDQHNKKAIKTMKMKGNI